MRSGVLIDERLSQEPWIDPSAALLGQTAGRKVICKQFCHRVRINTEMLRKLFDFIAS